LNNSSSILQIVPRPPGTQDGVGDYALAVARKLRDSYSSQTTFVANESASENIVEDFKVLSPLASVAHDDFRAAEFQHVILHYVNYGYHKRGIPFRLLPLLRQLRKRCRGHLLTIFHELYASGPPWKSEFWLRPLQIRIARSISRVSDVCIVSSETMRAQLKMLTPRANIRVHPVVSNFGEPPLSTDEFVRRSPHRWVICGGTILIERSLRSFREICNRIPEAFSPQELFVLGGKENPAIRTLLADFPGVRPEYHPQIEATEASRVLSSCSFAWLDYFHRTNVPTDAVLKSGAFAAACAHGVIPILPNRGSAISLEDDRLPGPFFVDFSSLELPAINDRAGAAAEFSNWYTPKASSDHLARGVCNALGLIATEQTR